MNISIVKWIVGLAILTVLTNACEDVVDIDGIGSEEGVIIDAWLNNLEETQEIRVSNAIAFFDNRLSPGITDATVSLMREDGVVLEFQHTEDGVYTWTPEDGRNIGDVGSIFKLEIVANGGTYSAFTTINRVPEIDEVVFEFRDDQIGGDDGLYAQFIARDFAGQGDAYWIRTFRDGVYQGAPAQLNIAFDAGFDAGSGVDGVVFITPIREALNFDADQGSIPTPDGQEVRVEIHSISVEGFAFLEIARDQINNGNNGIFALPLANAPSNITSSNDIPALGFFNIAAVSSAKNIAGQ